METNEIEKKEELSTPQKEKKCVLKDIFCAHKKPIIIGLAVVLALLALWPLVQKAFKPDPKFLYQAAIFPYDQKSSNPAEDQKSSHKRGDVLVIKKEEEGKKISWSRTERITYLILKLELTEEQAQKLTMADEREIPEKDWSEEEKQMAAEEKQRAEAEGREYQPEPKRETLRPRLYYVDLSKKPFNDFDRNVLLTGQPWEEDIFNWSIVEKKKKVD